MDTPDPVDALVAQWEPERPDLDLEAMAAVARLLNIARLIERELAALAAGHGVQVPEADVLFTLRRAGPPYRLLPSEISDSLLVSSGTLTNRLDRLEAKGLIERLPNPGDRRSVRVSLTDGGRALIDEAVTEHVENERRMLSALAPGERETLNRLTSKLLVSLRERARARPDSG